mmetsp:Transcript_10814/g.35509  ORF Transcript_10814/g.35509 Transcript_10814/m.35509 type:complete len:170 (+) Transcript_10814:3-512(+)
MFNAPPAYHDGEHRARTAAPGAFDEQLNNMQLTGGMMDFAGGFRGECLHLEKPSARGTGSVAAIYGIFKARSAADANELVQVLTAHGLTQLAAEPGALRFTIVLPGGDMPPQFRDELTVRVVEEWATSEDRAAHQTTPHLEAARTQFKRLVEAVSVVEYPHAVHYSKKP